MTQPTVKFAGVHVPAHLKGDDLLKWMKDNLALLIAEKKAATKEADPITLSVNINSRLAVDKDGQLTKAAENVAIDLGKADTVLNVINTTNIMDSHMDVHIPGIWKKSLKENKFFLHLQEHTMAFDHIISDEAKAYTEKIAWKDLGYDAIGTTEALIFATPFTGRNEYMEGQYRKGWVKNHSVGMRYVTIKFCVNRPDDDYYKEEYANWQNYIDQVINRDEAEARGMFWAVLEAKIVEGSAVVKGSNTITPSLGFKSAEPPASTQQNAPVTTTQVKEEKESVSDTKTEVDWEKVAKAIIN